MTTCCVLGLGYIGLPTSAVLASSGHSVVGVDIDPDVVDTVNQGRIHIVEPDLEQLVSSVVASGHLRVRLTPVEAEVFVIAVPTPFYSNNEGLPQPNIEYVLSAARSISNVIRPGNLVILESTSPVGTTETISSILYALTGLTSEQFHVAYCPERVLPGRILEELVSNDRVIGGLSDHASALSTLFYSSFCSGELLVTSARTAELVKLTENSYRDVNIAFANELSFVCDHLDVNVRELIRLSNHHPRVDILQPGCGVGGHCIAVDPWFIASAAPHCTPLIQTARHQNDAKSSWVIEQVKKKACVLEDQLGRPPIIGCLGLSFKPNVDDLRESPALHIVSQLIASGLQILACEPNLRDHPTINLRSIDDVLDCSDFLVFLVAHSQFIDLDISRYLVFDFCGVTDSV